MYTFDFCSRARRTTFALCLAAGLLWVHAPVAAQDNAVESIKAAMQKENWADAKDSIEAGLKLYPNDVRLLLLRGVLLARTGDLGGAREEFEALIKRFPELSEPYNNLGIVLAQAGDLNAALAQFSKAVLADPSNTEAQSNLARAQRALQP